MPQRFGHLHLPQSIAVAALAGFCAALALAQQTAQQPSPAQQPFNVQQSFNVRFPHSHNPFGPYLPSTVPEPVLVNSPRLDQLIHNGKLYLSLSDAIELALENNLDLAIARYNLPIAKTDLLRTQAGAPFLGVNTGVVENTPGGGVGGFGAGAPGAGAGGTTGGAGGAGAGAGGIVESTLGEGTPVSSFDPHIDSVASLEHSTQTLANLRQYGVPSLEVNTGLVNTSYLQAFPTGTSVEFDFDNSRQTINSPYEALTPALYGQWKFTVQQQLLAGFGFGANLRYLRIAKNDLKISDIAFKDQVIVTVTQIENIYWDLVAAYQDEQVEERSRDFAQTTLDNTRRQFALQAVPEMDVLKAEAEVATREQDLTVAKTNLQLEESLIKNALTKQLDDPLLEEMPVVPTQALASIQPETSAPLQTLISQALLNRPELSESSVDLDNRQITRRSLRNALLPTVTAVGYYAGSGLAGEPNPNYSLGQNSVNVPAGYGGTLQRTFDNSAPDYLAELEVSIPLRNRQAKADQFRSELEYRQAELRLVQLKKQIRIEVRNAVYALEQNAARVDAARQARDLAAKTFDITKQEQQLGAGSNTQTLSAEHDLSTAESALVTAQTTYAKARVELDRVTGSTLTRMGISIDAAKTGAPAPLKP